MATFLLAAGLARAESASQILSVRVTGDGENGKISAEFSGRPRLRPKQWWTKRGTCFVFTGVSISPRVPKQVDVASGAVKGVRIWRSAKGEAMVAVDWREEGVLEASGTFEGRQFVVNTRQKAAAAESPRLQTVESVASDRKTSQIRLSFTKAPEFRQIWFNHAAYVLFRAGVGNHVGKVAVDNELIRQARMGVTRAGETFLRLDFIQKHNTAVSVRRDGESLVVELGPKPKPSLAKTDGPVLLAANVPPSIPGGTPPATLPSTPTAGTGGLTLALPGLPSSDEQALYAATPSPRPPYVSLSVMEPPVQASAAEPPKAAAPVLATLPHNLLVVLKSEHLRLTVQNGIERIAVGDPSIISAEPIGTREILLLGKQWGHSSLLVWFKDHTVGEYRVWVQRDMATLRTALKRLHPRIEFEAATDRDAIVLMGTVPDLGISQAAVRIAQNYMDALGREPGEVLTQDPAASKDKPAGDTAAKPAIRVGSTPPRPSGTVINMLTLDELPETVEQKLTSVVRQIGGKDIQVRRMVKGDLPDDTADVFVLEGSVRSQVELTRVLLLAAQTVSGRTANQEDLRVIADESGAIMNGGNGAGGGGGGGGRGGMGGGTGGGMGGGQLFNQVGRNLARAKAIQVASGRVISFLQVRDLPQVRVNIRLYEVNRNKLRSFTPSLGILTSSPQQGALAAPGLATVLQGQAAQRTGGGGRNAIQSVLGFLGGALQSETQLSTSHFAIETALSYLEKAGVARSLSSPSLTVLSGEMAQFQVGGQIPLPQAFIPAFGNGAAGNNGVYSSVSFESFGVTVGVRPLVDENDAVTLDLIPQIVTPNADLTASIRNSTGTNQLTSSFLTRSLRTSARLNDGQSLLVGGLLSRDTNDSRNGTPGVQDVPGLGWLFKDFNKSDNAQELIVVVNPVVLREPLAHAGMWAYPPAAELLRLVPPATKGGVPGGK